MFLDFRLDQPRPSILLWNGSAAKSYHVVGCLHRRVRSFLCRFIAFVAYLCPHQSILTVLLMMYRVKGSILIGIFVTSIISWPRSTPVTYFPHNSAGDQLFDFFKQVVTWHPLKYVGNALDVSMFPLL